MRLDMFHEPSASQGVLFTARVRRWRQELLHHAGAGADFRRLSERLSPARLAAAWSHVATRLRSEGRAEGGATFMAAEPAMVACMAALLPEMDHVSTLIVVGATPCLLCSGVRGRRC